MDSLSGAMSSTHVQDLKPGLGENEEPSAAQHHEIVDLEVNPVYEAKGDNSDGHVNWTWKQILATISLCGVYVGKFSGI